MARIILASKHMNEELAYSVLFLVYYIFPHKKIKRWRTQNVRSFFAFTGRNSAQRSQTLLTPPPAYISSSQFCVYSNIVRFPSSSVCSPSRGMPCSSLDLSRHTPRLESRLRLRDLPGNVREVPEQNVADSLRLLHALVALVGVHLENGNT